MAKKPKAPMSGNMKRVAKALSASQRGGNLTREAKLQEGINSALAEMTDGRYQPSPITRLDLSRPSLYDEYGGFQQAVAVAESLEKSLSEVIQKMDAADIDQDSRIDEDARFLASKSRPLTSAKIAGMHGFMDEARYTIEFSKLIIENELARLNEEKEFWKHHRTDGRYPKGWYGRHIAKRVAMIYIAFNEERPKFARTYNIPVTTYGRAVEKIFNFLDISDVSVSTACEWALKNITDEDVMKAQIYRPFGLLSGFVIP